MRIILGTVTVAFTSSLVLVLLPAGAGAAEFSLRFHDNRRQ
jgi:hypothetical protein